MNFLNPSYSLAQNIDALFFARHAKLGDEFERLFNSVFDHAEDCMKIIRFLGTRHAGFTRNDIAKNTGLSPNGDFSKMLKALMGSDFVVKYVPYGVSLREEHYKLVDPFCWFWLHFKMGKKIKQEDYWQRHLSESEVASWRGIAFEELCLLHIDQIKNALHVRGVASKESSYVVRGDGEQDGTQIDLLIERADDVINICEMKFCKSPYVVTKQYAQTLSRRIEIMENRHPAQTFHLTYIGSTELASNEYSDIFVSVVLLDDLFAF